MLKETMLNANYTKRIALVVILIISVVLVFVYHSGKDEEKLPELNASDYLPIYMQDDSLARPQITSDRPLVACFTISPPSNRQKRDLIRKTWGKVAQPIFVIGKTNDYVMKMVYEEARQFNDIIVEDFVDSFDNLTIKTAFAMKNFLSYFPSSRFFFKVDDDVFVNSKNFEEFLEFMPDDHILGKEARNFKVVKDKKKKGYVPEHIFEDEYYPDFVLGPSYLIPGPMVPIIFSSAMTIPFLKSEDVFFTGVVAKKTLGFNIKNIPEFVYYNPTKDSSAYLKEMTIHGLPQEYFVKNWEIIESEDD